MNIDNIGEQIASQMLDALLCEHKISDDISRESKVEYIVERVSEMDIEVRYGIGDIMLKYDLGSDIRECSEGSVINLDKLADDVIDDIYDLMLQAGKNKN